MELSGSLKKVSHGIHKAWNWTERRLLVPENVGLASAGLPTYMPRQPHPIPQQYRRELTPDEPTSLPDKYAHYWDPHARTGNMAVQEMCELQLPEQDQEL